LRLLPHAKGIKSGVHGHERELPGKLLFFNGDKSIFFIKPVVTTFIGFGIFRYEKPENKLGEILKNP
jgi:hypothetical protein